METLTHSADALNTLKDFYDVDHVVFVEGQDDIPFWKQYFRRVDASCRYHFVPVGGCEQLREYIDCIVSSDAKVIVASDRDYQEFCEGLLSHPRVIYTYGHSIENTMYCPENLAKVISNFDRLLVPDPEASLYWLESFCESIVDLLTLDILNAISSTGVSVLGDSSVRFLQRSNSDTIDPRKVQEKYDELLPRFDPLEVATIRAKLISQKSELRRIIRGHFLSNAVINHIKKQVRSRTITLSHDHLYVALVEGSDSCFSDCEEWSYYRQKISDGLAAAH